jgi:hypothetical protein
MGNKRIEPYENPLQGIITLEDYKVLEQVIDQLSLPQKHSLKQVSENVGISYQRLINILSKPDVKKLIQKRIDLNSMAYESVAWESLGELVASGDLAAIKFFFELQGKYHRSHGYGNNVIFQNNNGSSADVRRLEEKLDELGDDFLKKAANMDTDKEQSLKDIYTSQENGDTDE